MIDSDLSKTTYGGKLSTADQRDFERRATIMDDNNNPPNAIYEDEKKIDEHV